MNKKAIQGFLLVEVLVALSVFTIAVGAAFLVFFGGQSLSLDSVNSEAAIDYGHEGLEAVRSIRDRDWNEVTNGSHGLVFLSGDWYFASSSITSDARSIFTRTVFISTIDAHTKQASTTITWQTDPVRTQSVQLVQLFTDWQESQNNGGDNGGDSVTGNWQNPTTLGSIDLGAGNSATDLDVLRKYVYITTTASDTKKKDFHIVDATNGQTPVLLSGLNTGDGLNGVDVAGNYAYVVQNDDDNQLQIIDVSTPSSPSLAASFNLSGVSGSGAIGNSIFYYANRVYIGTKRATGPELHIIDVIDPNNLSELGSREINADVNMIYVTGNKAYLATSDDSQEIQVWDISNPSSLTLLVSFNMTGTADAKSLWLAGTKLYVGRAVSTDKEFEVLDISNISAISSLGTFEIGADVNDVRVSDYLAFVGTTDSNKEFQVLNITNLAGISLWSSFNFPQVATGIDYENNMVYVSVRSNDALRILTSQ